MPRTREQDRVYQAARRAEKNGAPDGTNNSATLTLLKSVTADADIDLSDLAQAVRAEIDAIPTATKAMPGLAALAIRLAVLVETADNAGAAAQAAAQLRSTLLAVRAEAKLVAPVAGKLAALQSRRQG